MATERLHMSGEPYHAYEAAAHVARYALLRPLCAGKRVLDIACGEGYGSALLAGWGARHVVGMDISAEAIASAERHFAHPNIRFLPGNAEQAPALLADEPPFDLVVSFETVEHVADPVAFLHGLRQLCSPAGSILVSCPNDPAALTPGAVNQFHLRSYTFAQFRAFAEAILGPASAWLIETPVIGLLHYLLGDTGAEIPAAGPTAILDVRDLQGGLQMPAQAGAAPSPQDCLAYIGIWGGIVQPSYAIAPMSHSGYMFPWRNLERVEQQVERFSQEQQEDRRQLLHYAQTIAALRQTHATDREQAERHLAQIGALTAQVQDAAQRIESLNRRAEADEQQLAALMAEFVASSTDLMLARHWRGEVERSRCYRMLRAYVGLYRLPVIGLVLGTLRRGAARLRGGFRGG